MDVNGEIEGCVNTAESAIFVSINNTVAFINSMPYNKTILFYKRGT